MTNGPFQHKHANRRIFDFIQFLDDNPGIARPVHFYFYTLEEADAYRLAEELKQLDFEVLQVSRSLNNQWLCLAGMELQPAPLIMDRCTEVMLKLADRYNAVYDGWETLIDLNEPCNLGGRER